MELWWNHMLLHAYEQHRSSIVDVWRRRREMVLENLWTPRIFHSCSGCSAHARAELPDVLP
jgi:hypothetical protein